jgi:hypothetical protein
MVSKRRQRGNCGTEYKRCISNVTENWFNKMKRRESKSRKKGEGKRKEEKETTTNSEINR